MPARKSGNPYRWLMLSFPFLIAFLLHLLLFATAPMVTVIIGEMNLSYAEFGLVFSAAMVSLILFRIPWGFIGDKIGYVDAFKIALPISAASAILRAFSSSYTSLLLSQIFLGLGLADGTLFSFHCFFPFPSLSLAISRPSIFALREFS